ncbi:hypothetical protein evm_000755 [Chilo suppressalis]|nr:hypothetical protein evm_000755 [Chilo suppressalis]
MVPQILLIWCLIAAASTSEIDDDKEPATSYSIIYRYDTPEKKTDSNTNINTYGQESKVNYETQRINQEIPIVYEKKPIAYEKISDSGDMRLEQAQSNTFSDYASKIYEENLMHKYNSNNGLIQTISPFQASLTETKIDSLSSSSLSAPLLSKTATYPSLTSGPLIQEGRLITPGLSAYASNSIMEN